MPRLRPRALRAVAALLLPLGAAAFVVQHPAVITGIELFTQVMKLTVKGYVKQIPEDSLYALAAHGMIQELHDPFSELFTPEDAKEFERAMSGHYAGIGIGTSPMPGGIVVQNIAPSAPAAHSGLLAGDLIVQIDTLDVRSGDSARVLGHIRGPTGTTVTLHVLRPGVAHPIVIPVTRAPVHVSAVPYTLMLPHHVGYVPLLIFNSTAAQDLRTAIQRLVDSGATRLVLDLRDNGGGETDQAVEISNLFLPRGAPVVTFHSPSDGDRTVSATSAPAFPTIPLVVLVDGFTASSSEIVTGALQDHDRARVIGTTTFGKGIGQGVHRLPGGYLLKLTEFTWLTPAGRSIQRDRTVLDLYADPDSMESDSALKARPTFHSDAGRVLYGGGGIVPDEIVHQSWPGQRALVLALAHGGTRVPAVVARYAATLRGKVHQHFAVTPAMRNTVVRQLRQVGVTIDDATLAHGRRTLDNLIGMRVTTLLFGDSTAKRKYLSDDAQLHAALAALARMPNDSAGGAAQTGASTLSHTVSRVGAHTGSRAAP